MSFLTTKKRVKKFQKKIELYGFLGALALLFLAPGCGSDSNNDNDDPEALYGAAVFTCTEDADCVEEYGEGYVCTDSECVEPAAFTCTGDADCVEEYGEGYVCTDSECVEPNVVYGPPA